jgi:hypothetical protein
MNKPTFLFLIAAFVLLVTVGGALAAELQATTRGRSTLMAHKQRPLQIPIQQSALTLIFGLVIGAVTQVLGMGILTR